MSKKSGVGGHDEFLRQRTPIGTCYLTPSPSNHNHHIAEMRTRGYHFVSCIVKKGQMVSDAFRVAANNVTWCICSSVYQEAPCSVQARVFDALQKIKIIPLNPNDPLNEGTFYDPTIGCQV
jgi:hypothetical protein